MGSKTMTNTPTSDELERQMHDSELTTDAVATLAIEALRETEAEVEQARREAYLDGKRAALESYLWMWSRYLPPEAERSLQRRINSLTADSDEEDEQDE